MKFSVKGIQLLFYQAWEHDTALRLLFIYPLASPGTSLINDYFPFCAFGHLFLLLTISPEWAGNSFCYWLPSLLIDLAHLLIIGYLPFCERRYLFSLLLLCVWGLIFREVKALNIIDLKLSWEKYYQWYQNANTRNSETSN